MDASLHHWTIIFLFAAGQGFFLSVLLLAHKTSRQKGNHYLALIVLLFSFSLVHYVTYWMGLLGTYPHFIASSDTFIFLYGPLMFLYIYKFAYNKSPKYNFIHFLPFLIFLLISLPFYLSSGPEKIKQIQAIIKDPNHVYRYLRIAMDILANVHILIYCGVLFYMVRKESLFSKSFVLYIFLSFAGFALSFANYYILSYAGLIRPIYDYAISFAMAFFIYTIGYMGYRQPYASEEKSKMESKSKYENSTLKHVQAKRCVEALQKLMEEEKIFLENDLKIKDVADKLSVSVHHLSQAINENLGQSYSDFINSYRIKEAQKRLLYPEYENLKIIAVAYDVGFNNKASFNTNFKKFTGMSPSEYRKQKQITSQSS